MPAATRYKTHQIPRNGDSKLFLTLRMASDVVSLSARTLRRAIDTGRLKAYRPNDGRGVILVRRTDLLRYVESRPVDSPANGGDV